MLNKYRLFQRAKGVFYWQDNAWENFEPVSANR